MTAASNPSGAFGIEAHANLTSADIERLQHFHQAHFPGQQIPEISPPNHTEDETTDDDGLGYYADGVKRTLTYEQVKMFRHSEIQRLLSERKQAQSKAEQEKRRQRRQEKRAIRPPRFDDEPVKRQDDVELLMYDDEPTAEHEEKPPAEKKFLWPVLGP